MKTRRKTMLTKIIKNLREQTGWTQQQFADKAKLSVPTISKIEKGERPNLKNLMKILKALCLNIDDLLNDKTLTAADIAYLENKKCERLYYGRN